VQPPETYDGRKIRAGHGPNRKFRQVWVTNIPEARDAFQIDSKESTLHLQKEDREMTYEYKSIVLPFKVGLFRQGLPDIEAALNPEGREGWRLKQLVLPSSSWGTSDSMVAILERQVSGEA